MGEEHSFTFNRAGADLRTKLAEAGLTGTSTVRGAPLVLGFFMILSRTVYSAPLTVRYSAEIVR